jgi:hypothetical protein
MVHLMLLQSVRDRQRNMIPPTLFFRSENIRETPMKYSHEGQMRSLEGNTHTGSICKPTYVNSGYYAHTKHNMYVHTHTFTNMSIIV